MNSKLQSSIDTLSPSSSRRRSLKKILAVSVLLLTSLIYFILVAWLAMLAEGCASPGSVAATERQAAIEVSDTCTPFIDSYLDGSRTVCYEFREGNVLCMYETKHDCVDKDEPGRWIVTLERKECNAQWRMENLWCCPVTELPRGIR